jgi:hypothetical protein
VSDSQNSSIDQFSIKQMLEHGVLANYDGVDGVHSICVVCGEHGNAGLFRAIEDDEVVHVIAVNGGAARFEIMPQDTTELPGLLEQQLMEIKKLTGVTHLNLRVHSPCAYADALVDSIHRAICERERLVTGEIRALREFVEVSVIVDVMTHENETYSYTVNTDSWLGEDGFYEMWERCNVGQSGVDQYLEDDGWVHEATLRDPFLY